MRPPVEPGDSARIAIRKLSGYPTEDPAMFLSYFEAYCKISGITDSVYVRKSNFPYVHAKFPNCNVSAMLDYTP